MDKYVNHDEYEQIKELLMYRKVTKVNDNTLFLDNGVELKILPNEG